MRALALLLLLCPVAAMAAPLIPVIAGLALASTTAFYVATVVVAVYSSVQARIAARRAASQARAAYNAGLSDRSATALQAEPPWRVVYGRAIVGGDIVAIFTSDKTASREDGTSYTKPDAYKHLVIAIAAHECEAINEIYIGGVPLGALDGSGWVTGGDFYFTRTDTRYKAITGPGSVTVPEPVASIIDSYIRAGDSTLDVTVTLSSGNTVITATDTATVHVDYTTVVELKRVRASVHLGTDSQTVDTYLNSVKPTEWDSTHRLRGIAYAVVTLDLEDQRFQGGPPQITFDVSGRKIYDPRTSTTAYSTNPALCVRDFLTAPWGYEVLDDEVNEAACIAAANACDAPITVTVGALVNVDVPTYTCNGAFTTAESKESVLLDLCESMAGVATYGAEWSVHAGVWTVPVMDLTDDDLDGQIEIVQAGVGLDDLFNGIRGSYIDSGKSSPTDFDPYQNATFLAADGQELWEDRALPFTNNKARCKNLARIFVEQARSSQIIRYPAKLIAWPLQVGDRVTVTSAEYGFDTKIYRVTDWHFDLRSAVVLTLQEDDATIYDLADAATADPTPNTNLPNPWIVSAITGLAATSSASTMVKSGAATLVPRVDVTWDAIADAYVSDGSGRIEVLWRAGNKPWHQVNVPGDETSASLVGMSHDDRIVIEVRAVNGLGAVGPSTFLGHSTVGAALIDTPQLAPNAATEVYSTTPSGAVTITGQAHTPDGFNASWNTQITTVSFTPSQSGNAQVFFDGRGNYTESGVAAAGPAWSIQDSAGTGTYDGWKRIDTFIAKSTTASFSMATTRTIPVTGGTTYTFAVYAHKSSAGDTFTVDNMQLRVEVVKA